MNRHKFYLFPQILFLTALFVSTILLSCFYLEKSFASSEKKISKQDVISSANKHYPQILSYYEKVNSSQGSALSSLGFFDIKLKQNYLDKTKGYYDGKISDSTLEKELGFMGGKIYGGYRKSSGDFANYDGNNLTNSGGEYRLGARFSLLRNNSIDQNRLGVMLSNLGVEESKIQLERITKEIERDATKAYWRWIAAERIFHVYEELYKLSLKRQSQLEEKLKRGDVARIIVVENKKNILRRKSALAKAQQDFENAAIYLSLFWRDENGLPIIAKKNQVPEFEFKINEITNYKMANDLEFAFLHRPEVRMLKIQKEQDTNKLKYSKNLFKPQLDVDFGHSKDLGNGPISRSQTNNNIALEFSIPLQQREARGKVAEYESNLKSIKLEQQLIEDKIKAELDQIKVQIDATVEIYKNLLEEVKLAELLEKSEQEKFLHGASNFFLVNMREQDTALSKASYIEMFEKYQAVLADYKMAVFSN